MDLQQRIRIIVPLAAIAAVFVIVQSVRNGTASVPSFGTVEATEAVLGFQLAGRVDAVTVREGDRVARDSRLASLDATELQARLAAANAAVGAAEAVLRELRSGFRSEEQAQAQSALEAAEQRVLDAERDVDRSRILFEGGAISRELLDKHTTALEVALADRDRMAQNLALLQAGPRPERIAQQAALVEQARANARIVEATLQTTVITAPFDGLITVRHTEPGEIVSPGRPVLTLMNPDDRWVRIYVREDAVGGVSVGQAASIRIDTFPDRAYDGRVTFIASEAEFVPRNVQTTEERVRLVYEVRVTIVGDEQLDLKPGIAADVTLL